MATSSMPTPPSSAARTLRRRVWLFRLAAVALSLAPLLLLELGLRSLGVGYDTRLIEPIRRTEAGADAVTLYRFNPNADRSYYGVEDLWGPDPRPFQIPKPAGTYRVVVVGGSSVAGFPYPFELALPRQLELVLQRQLPGRKVEVLNAGMTAIMSASEVDVLRQTLNCQPDLIVVHSGHNEFYGPGGSASNYSSVVASLRPLAQQARKLRSVQLLLSLVPKPRKTHLVATLPADIHIPLDGPLFEQTRQKFERNLTRMVEAAVRAGIPILLSTVPSNQRDLAPLQPTERENTLQRLREFERRASYREYDAGLDVLQTAHQDDPADPLVVYRMAQCLEKLGRIPEAASEYTRAADLDGCRFRAASQFLDAVRSVAEHGEARVYFCDVADQLRMRSRFPSPGADYFLEHVHYNLEGTWEVASILGKTIVTDVLGGTWQLGQHPDPAARDRILGITPLDHLAAQSLTVIGFESWPFTLSPARGEESQRMKGLVAAGYQALDPNEQVVFASLDLDAMHQQLWLAMGDRWLQAGAADRALAAYQRHIERRGWDPAGYRGAAAALRLLGKPVEAEAMLGRMR